MSGMETGHLSLEQLQKYVRDELTPDERVQADQELLFCEGCLWQFMSVMESMATGANSINAESVMPDMSRLEDRVIEELLAGSSRAGTAANSLASLSQASQSQAKESQPSHPQVAESQASQASHPKSIRRDSWLQHPAAQYTIAASITLMLLATGALTGFSEKLQQLDETDFAKPPYSADVAWEAEPTWSERMVSRAGNWLDGVQALRFK